MTADARRRAEACFAVARSTTFEHEKATAIERGTRIARAAGLSLDTFDIPGRKRGPTASQFADDLFSRPRSPAFTEGTYTAEELIEVMERFAAGLRRSQEDAYTQTLNEALRRTATAATAKEKARREGQRERAVASRAADFLAARNVNVYPVDPLWTRWIVNGEDRSSDYMIQVAERMGFKP